MLSVIARKIAIANQPAPSRPDADKVALPLLPFLRRALLGWMSVEEITLEMVQAEWARPQMDWLDGPSMTSQGARRSQRAFVIMNQALAQRAALDVLRVDAEPSPEEMAALDPFVRENMVSLGERLNDTPMGIAAGEPDWTLPDPETLSPEWAPYETLSITVRIVDTGAADLLVRVGVTEDLLIAVGASRSKAETPVAVPKPPRLGPCHVDVRAVGDRVTMSVADCTRLEIGQVVGLPGLRFDHLELDVELGDGPRPLTDAALGADKGRKAVRLNRGLDPDFRVRPPHVADSDALPRTFATAPATAGTVPA